MNQKEWCRVRELQKKCTEFRTEKKSRLSLKQLFNLHWIVFGAESLCFGEIIHVTWLQIILKCQVMTAGPFWPSQWPTLRGRERLPLNCPSAALAALWSSSNCSFLSLQVSSISIPVEDIFLETTSGLLGCGHHRREWHSAVASEGSCTQWAIRRRVPNLVQDAADIPLGAHCVSLASLRMLQ